jgi:hypothetical protein
MLHRQEAASPAAAPAPADTAGDIPITYGDDADSSKVSAKSLEILQGILRAAKETTAKITSTARTPEEQAAVMYVNIASKGAQSQYDLYGPHGDRVIDVYVAQKDAKKTYVEIKAAMTAKIEDLGPSNVSHHCADSSKLNVIDVAPSSLKHEADFKKAAEAEVGKRVKRFIPKGDDPAYHFEIEQ